MSHFTVLVIGMNPDLQLAPYNENLETPRYIEFTKEQLINKGKKEIENYKKGTYAEFLSNPEKYKKNCHNDKHIIYLECEFPKRLDWTDEQIYLNAIKYYEPDNIGEDGEVYSEYNPKSKWDWYSLGGRWMGSMKLRKGKTGILGESGVFNNTPKPGTCDQALLKNIDRRSITSTFAVIKNGKWYERGEMGWWAIVSNEKSDDVWDKEFKILINNLDSLTLLSIYDCHI